MGRGQGGKGGREASRGGGSGGGGRKAGRGRGGGPDSGCGSSGGGAAAAAPAAEGRGGGAAASPRLRPAAAADPGEVPAPVAVDSTNDGVLLQVEQSCTTILQHDIFGGLKDTYPLGNTGGGSAQPSSWMRCIRDSGSYTCQINLFWMDLKFIAMAGVPIRTTAIDDLTRTQQGQRLQSVMEIAVDDPAAFNPMDHKGAWRRVSPPEEVFSFLARAARDITEGRGDDVLQSWRRAFLDVTARFVILPTPEDMWWHEYNVRERLGTAYRTMYQTAYQRICGVLRIIQERAASQGAGAATVNKIITLYEERAEQAAGNENGPPEAFIREVFAIKDTLLGVRGFHEAVKMLDSQLGHRNPLNSVYKLTPIRRACKTAELTEWVIQAMADNILAGVEALQGISVHDMSPGRHRCLPQCYLLKRQLLDYLMVKADELFPADIASKLREVFASHASFREMYRPMAAAHSPEEQGAAAASCDLLRAANSASQKPPDLTYLASWPGSARVYMDFIALTVFSHEQPYATGFQGAARTGRAMISLFDHVAFREAWDHIHQLREVEKRADKAKEQAGWRSFST